MSAKRTADTQVAISGGGPVGLCLGLLLARSGVEVRLFEAEPALSQDLRASTFHPPTLDMLDRISMADALVAQGLICPDWQVRMHPSGERAVFDLSVLAGETAHPYRLQCEQWKLSRLLLEALKAEPAAEITFGARTLGVSQDGDGAALRIETEAGTETVRAAIVVGADGARSQVRRAMDLSLDGETFPETTILATTTFPFEDHLEGLSNVSYCWTEGGNFSLLKVPGRWRVSIYPDEDRPVEEQLEPHAIEDALQAVVPRGEPYEVMETRPYRVHQRIVPTYVSGRMVLVGDAAHLNSPSGGMGLNGGLHDAFELAPIVTDIVDAGASPDALSLYDRRRRPIAADQILAQAGRNRARMRNRNPEQRRAILADLQAIAADPHRLKAHLMRTSMIEGLRMAETID